MSDDLPAFDGDRTQVVLRAGLRCFGRYTLVGKLGEGGMGVVWLARDEKLERDVALKFLPEHVRQDPEALRDLRREVRRCLELAHPHIVRVNDLVEDATTAAIAMEYVPGSSLAARKAARPGGCFDAAELAPLVTQLCSALDYAHTVAKVVHRDLKPANLLVTDAGVLKIADFGIARSLAETQTRLTQDLRSTTVTLSFASPQQIAGARPSPADDLYAVGATLYDLLTGKPPFFRGDVLRQIESALPEPLSARRAELENTGAPIPAAWEETILACLAKRPKDRPASAVELARQLAANAPPAEVDPDATQRIELPKSAGLRRELAAANRSETESRLPTTATNVAPIPADSTDAGPPSRWRTRGKWFAGATLVVVAGILAFIFWPRGAPEAESKKAIADAQQAASANQPSPGTAPKTETRTALPPPAPAASIPREFIVRVDPPDAGARVWIGPQTDIAVPAGGRLAVRDLSDGEHELTVQAAGYQPYSTRVRVTDGRGEAEAKLVAVHGVLEVKARPGTVVTAIDPRGRETSAGTVPANGTLLVENLLIVGRYRILLAQPDCAPVEAKDVDLAPGRVARIAPAQSPLPGELRVFSAPDGAEVWLNGAKVGSTPATLRALPSETPLAVEIRAAGYRSFTRTVTLKPREVQTVNASTLAIAPGALELQFAGAMRQLIAGMTAKIDGKAFSPSGVIHDLEPGEHMIEVAHPDYESFTAKVVVRDSETTRLEVKLIPKPATLILQVSGPTSYTLRVNGEPVPVTGGRANVLARQELTLEIASNGYEPSVRKLTLPPGDSFKWEVTLSKKASDPTGTIPQSEPPGPTRRSIETAARTIENSYLQIAEDYVAAATNRANVEDLLHALELAARGIRLADYTRPRIAMARSDITGWRLSEEEQRKQRERLDEARKRLFQLQQTMRSVTERLAPTDRTLGQLLEAMSQGDVESIVRELQARGLKIHGGAAEDEAAPKAMGPKTAETPNIKMPVVPSPVNEAWSYRQIKDAQRGTIYYCKLAEDSAAASNDPGKEPSNANRTFLQSLEMLARAQRLRNVTVVRIETGRNSLGFSLSETDREGLRKDMTSVTQRCFEAAEKLDAFRRAHEKTLERSLNALFEVAMAGDVPRVVEQMRVRNLQPRGRAGEDPFKD